MSKLPKHLRRTELERRITAVEEEVERLSREMLGLPGNPPTAPSNPPRSEPDMDEAPAIAGRTDRQLLQWLLEAQDMHDRRIGALIHGLSSETRGGFAAVRRDAEQILARLEQAP